MFRTLLLWFGTLARLLVLPIGVTRSLMRAKDLTHAVGCNRFHELKRSEGGHPSSRFEFWRTTGGAAGSDLEERAPVPFHATHAEDHSETGGHLARETCCPVDG